MENNVYLTNEQKELIVLMCKERHERIMEAMERLTREYISDEDYQIIRKRIANKRIDNCNQLTQH